MSDVDRDLRPKRRDRRRAEARQRAFERRLQKDVEARATELATARESPAGIIPSNMLADFFKGVAVQVARLEFRGLSDIGGKCIFKTLAAYQAACMGGADVRIGFGGLVARVGPDQHRDVVAFCGPHNMGAIHDPSGYAAFHCPHITAEEWAEFDRAMAEWQARRREVKR
jgi:hypothetical protein